jgi:hypothetical protein
MHPPGGVIDTIKRAAIETCGTCGHPERAHQHQTGTDEEAILVMAALGGPCPRFTVSDAAVTYQKHLAITNNRAPKRQNGGQIGKRKALCKRCGNRGHGAENCPL